MEGSEAPMEDKPTYDWKTDFREFEKYCPKFNPMSYEVNDMTREESCDNAQNCLVAITEYFMKIKEDRKENSLSAVEKVLINSEAFNIMLRECGSKCGTCAENYIRAKLAINKEERGQ